MSLVDFENGSVLVIGDVLGDVYFSGDVRRISPEAPVPVVKVDCETIVPGGAGNVARNLSALGSKATLLGILGNDRYGNSLKQLFSENNISFPVSLSENFETIAKVRVVSDHHQLLRLDFGEGNSELPPYLLSDLFSKFRECVLDSAVVILSDYAKGSLVDSKEIISYAKAVGKFVIVDPKGKDFSRYVNADLITPNLTEFFEVVGECSSDDIIVSKAIDLCETYSIENILVTRSENGMSLVNRSGSYMHIPANVKDVYDVTGAGDTVVATIAACYAASLDLIESVKLANIAAGIAVGKFGTSIVTSEELGSTVPVNRYLSKYVDLVHLKSLRDLAEKAGKSFVMTNGCFDLLHPGHVSLLQGAAELGDVLVVAINTDDSIRKLKGESRPVYRVEDRIAMLAALDCVDYIVTFDEADPSQLYAEIIPDVLVKGGDYSPTDVVGHDVVVGAGGRVQIIPLIDGISTTALISRIKI